MTSQLDFSWLIAAQNEIIAHWQAVRSGEALPCRRSINPGKLRAHLGSISILEVDTEGQTRLRLVGTRLRDLAGGNMQGRSIADVSHAAAGMWQTGLVAAARSDRPFYGIEDIGNHHHAWLRCPLASDAEGQAKLVLCHDVMVRKVHRERPFFMNRLPLVMRSVAA